MTKKVLTFEVTAGGTTAAETIELSGLVTDTLRGDGTCAAPAGLLESSGPTTLATGSILDGEYLKRVGTTLVGATIAGGGDMLKSEDLSGLANYVTARSNMGLGTAAITAATDYATAAQGATADTALQSIANGSITLAKQADVATATVFYRKTAGTGAPEVTLLSTLKTDLVLVKADVGLGNADNTTDAGKPVSTATQTALDGKQVAGSYASGTGSANGTNTGDQDLSALAPKASPTFTGTVSGVTAAMVGAPAGSGNSSGTNTGDNATNTQYSGLAASKQDTLVSGTNIKTINGAAITGSGNLVVSGSYALVAILASDQATGANITPVNLTGLVFTYAINSVYMIRFMGRVSPAAATTGCGFQFDLSSAVTDVNVAFIHNLATTGTLLMGNSIADDASAVVTTGMPANGGLYPVVGHAIIRTGANTGTAQLRFRSETTAVTTAKAGFTLVVEKIA